MPQIKAVIFDYGNVLCQPQQREDLDAMAAALGLERGKFEELYWRKRLPYDCSELSPRQYWDDFCRMAGVPALTPDQLASVMLFDSRSWAHVDPAMIAWARQLRSGELKTAVLSNMPLPLREYLDREYAWLQDFDFRVFSCDVRMAKPAAEIYEMCLRGLGVAANEAIFFDDREDNIRAAQQLGIHGLLFTSPEKAMAELPVLVS